MGGSAVSRDNTTVVGHVKKSQTVQETVHNVFGKISIVSCLFDNDKKGLAYKKEMMIESPDIARKLLEYSKLTDPDYTARFLKVFGYQVEKREAVCGSTTVASIYFEPFQTSLTSLLSQRREKGLGRFEEKELVNIIHSICCALRHLRIRRVKHLNISLDTIFQADSQFKTYHPEILKPVTGDNTNKYLNKKKHYLAAEMLRPAARAPGQAPHDPYLADIYSLGLVLLELCTLKTELGFYGPDQTVLKDLIQAKLGDMADNYTNGFIEMVIRMLTIDPRNRITLDELTDLTTSEGQTDIQPQANHDQVSMFQQQAQLSQQEYGHNQFQHGSVPQINSNQALPPTSPAMASPSHATGQGNLLNMTYGQYKRGQTPEIGLLRGSQQSRGLTPDNGAPRVSQQHRNNTPEMGPLRVSQQGPTQRPPVPTSGLARQGSNGNFFDPNILNRVQNRDNSRQPRRERDASPLNVSLNRNQEDRSVPRDQNEGRTRLPSRQRTDLSRSPLLKTYGSGQQLPDVSMQSHNSNNGTQYSNPQYPPPGAALKDQANIAMNLNNAFATAAIDQPDQPQYNHHLQNTDPQNHTLLIPTQQTVQRVSQSGNIQQNPMGYGVLPQMQQAGPIYHISPSPAIPPPSNHIFMPPIVVQQQHMSYGLHNPIHVQAAPRPIEIHSQPPTIASSEQSRAERNLRAFRDVSPSPTGARVVKVTRYSLDKNGNRRLVEEDNPIQRREEHAETSVPNAVVTSHSQNQHFPSIHTIQSTTSSIQPQIHHATSNFVSRNVIEQRTSNNHTTLNNMYGSNSYGSQGLHYHNQPYNSGQAPKTISTSAIRLDDNQRISQSTHISAVQTAPRSDSVSRTLNNPVLPPLPTQAHPSNKPPIQPIVISSNAHNSTGLYNHQGTHSSSNRAEEKSLTRTISTSHIPPLPTANTRDSQKSANGQPPAPQPSQRSLQDTGRSDTGIQVPTQQMPPQTSVTHQQQITLSSTFAKKSSSESSAAVQQGSKLIEKYYIKDDQGNTIELKTYLDEDGARRTERRIAIDANGQLYGKFKETGVNLEDVIYADPQEVKKTIENQMAKLSGKKEALEYSNTKSAAKQHKSPEKTSDMLKQDDDFYHGLQTFNAQAQMRSPAYGQGHQSSAMSSANQFTMGVSPAKIDPKDSDYFNNNNRKEDVKVQPFNNFLHEKENIPNSQQHISSLQLPPSPSKGANTMTPSSSASNFNIGTNMRSSGKYSNHANSPKTIPPGLAGGEKGRTIKVRYKEHNGRTYPVGISGTNLNREEKEWLFLKVLEREGLTLQEVEEIEGGPLMDQEDGSEYRLTAERDGAEDDGQGSSQNEKNQRASNLVKDIQNQVINEQEEDMVSQSSAHPSHRIVAVGDRGTAQKFDLMHGAQQDAKNDEIWFRTREQKVLEEIDAYRNIDMSKSSKKPHQIKNHQASGTHAYESADGNPSQINTKFNYGTNSGYNARLSNAFGSNDQGSVDANPSGYDPTDIDTLLKHNENLLSKIKMDMKNIGESFVSHTDMGGSRGFKPVGGANQQRAMMEYDSKELQDRSAVGIQDFESFKTKQFEERNPKSPNMQFKYNYDDLEMSQQRYEHHRQAIDNIWNN